MNGNGMLRHSYQGEVISLQTFIVPYKSCLKVILFFQQGNILFGGIFQVERLFQKLWPLLYKRAELDLRLTKIFKKSNDIRLEERKTKHQKCINLQKIKIKVDINQIFLVQINGAVLDCCVKICDKFVTNLSHIG